MSYDRATYDAFHKLLGYSQEFLDNLHKDVDDYRMKIYPQGPQLSWEPAESDSELEDIHFGPLSPPPSPKHKREEPDLSEEAWNRRILADLGRGIDIKDSGFGNIEAWRIQMISEYEQRVLAVHLLSSKYKGCFTGSKRTTRSKASSTTLFYELGHDGKTAQPLSKTFFTNAPRSRCLRQAKRPSPQRKYRSDRRISKK